MAAITLPKPGTELGPCESADCGHKDCALTREQAAAVCRYCNEPIGYDKRFYFRITGESSDNPMHEVCFIEHFEGKADV